MKKILLLLTTMALSLLTLTAFAKSKVGIGCEGAATFCDTIIVKNETNYKMSLIKTSSEKHGHVHIHQNSIGKNQTGYEGFEVQAKAISFGSPKKGIDDMAFRVGGNNTCHIQGKLATEHSGMFSGGKALIYHLSANCSGNSLSASNHVEFYLQKGVVTIQ